MADINVTEEIIDINVTEEVITIAAGNGAYPLPYPVYSVFGRTGSVVAAEGDYSLTQLSDVTLTSPANGQVLKYNGTSWVNSTDADTGITTLNTLTALSQTFATGTSGTDFNISSATSTHTFNIPTASATNRGLLSSADWSTFNAKQNALTNPVTGTGTTNTLPKFTAASTIGNSNISDSGSLITLGSNSYLNGNVGIGITPSTNRNLLIENTLTGSTVGIGIFVTSTIASDVTSQATYFRSNSSTQAATFTLANLYNFSAVQGTFGVGSTVTAQYGYFASSTLIGATNNYGFFGAIASGTNRWNIYMEGTANNYMAGSLGIGRTSLSNMSLGIDKNITGGTVAYGIYNSGTIQSDVTSSGVYNTTAASTAAASFTLTNLFHYAASQSTFGAGSIVTNQYGYNVSANLIGATNNYGFFGSIPSGTNRWNLFMSGTADNYLAGNVGIGVSQGFVSSGPILTTTLTNGGSGYVDGTYVDVDSSNISASLVSDYAKFTIIVSGGIVTSATLTWGGTTYRAGDTLTVSNTLLGGTGSGLIITVNTVDSSILTIAGNDGADITLFRRDTSLSTGENIGTIKWSGSDSSAKASGLYAEIGAFAAGNAGGAYLSFFTRSASAGTSLVEAMRIDSRGGVGIGATALTEFSLRVSKNITGATSSFGISSDGVIQSGVTTQTTYIQTSASTAAASFTIGSLRHFRALQGTIGAGSTVTSQYGFEVDSSLIGATNNYGFYGNIASGTNRWNLYMNGTANNYMAGALGIGTTSLTDTTLNIAKNITGAATYVVVRQSGVVQSDANSNILAFNNQLNTQATSFVLTQYIHYNATQGTIGAGSSVATNTGFNVSPSMIGGTNNYGFRSGIPVGAGRWNLYIDGTAANYLNGNTGLGTLPTTTAELSLGAGTTAQAQINLASSTAPTSPVNGDIWFDGTSLKIRIGGVTRTVTVT